jgi:hypothetical protein
MLPELSTTQLRVWTNARYTPSPLAGGNLLLFFYLKGSCFEQLFTDHGFLRDGCVHYNTEGSRRKHVFFRLLISRINEPNLNFRTVHTESTLILRESTDD